MHVAVECALNVLPVDEEDTTMSSTASAITMSRSTTRSVDECNSFDPCDPDSRAKREREQARRICRIAHMRHTRKTQPCTTWNDASGCVYGAKCRFWHPGDVRRVRPAAKELRRAVYEACARAGIRPSIICEVCGS